MAKRLHIFNSLFLYLFLQQHNVMTEKEESKELDILWRKYGDLRSDVEELKSKHRNDYRDPGHEKTDTTTVNYEEKNTKDEIRFIPIGPKLISAIIEKDDGYWAYKVKLLPVTDMYFQCGVDFRIIQFRQDGKIRNKPYPTVIEKEGVLEVTCFRENNIYSGRYLVYLSVLLIDAPTISIVFNIENGEGTQELEWLDFQYHAFPSEMSNGMCKTNITLRWNPVMNVTRANINAYTRVLYINGSKTTADTILFTKNEKYDPKAENMNLTTKYLEDRKEFEIISSMSKIDPDREDLQGIVDINVVYHPFTPVVQTIYLFGISNDKTPCIPKIEKGKFALLAEDVYSLKEGEMESIFCTGVGNPAPTIIMYIETQDKTKNLITTQPYRFKDTFSQVVKTWESTPRRIGGKIICEAESGTKSIRKEIELKIFSTFWIAKQTKVKSNNGNKVKIQLKAKSAGLIHFNCFLNKTYGRVLFREKVNNDGISGTEQLNITDNPNSKQQDFTNDLEEVDPMITRYMTSSKAVNKTIVKTSRLTIDLRKAKQTTPFNLVCSAFENPWDSEKDWIEILWPLHQN